MHVFALRSLIETLEWFFVARWGIVIWSNYVIIVERTCTSESMNPRTCFNALQYHLRSLLSLVTMLFIISDYKNLYLPSILHLYHHIFAELVHLYNLPLYWMCWGHKRLFVIWLQDCLRETIFILHLLWIDKPQVIHLREIFYCPTNLCTWRPNNVYKKKVA